MEQKKLEPNQWYALSDVFGADGIDSLVKYWRVPAHTAARRLETALVGEGSVMASFGNISNLIMQLDTQCKLFCGCLARI